MPVATLPITHGDWQILRVLVRAQGLAVPGKKLRIVPSRRTKDGTFLDDLVTMGLLVAESVDELPQGAPPSAIRAPVQFRTRYRLTAKGEHAAEYGECEQVYGKDKEAAKPKEK